MPPDAEAWARARGARAKLEQAILDDPAVSLIDIGFSSEKNAGPEGRELVLRVHLRSSGPGAPNLPGSVDGVRVEVAPGDYRLEG